MSTIEVIEPATEQVMAELPRAGVEEVDAAVARAKAAFPAWRAVAPADRGDAASAASPTRSSRALEELATLEARNAGKPIADARGEIGMVVETFRYYAGAPERLLGQTIPVAGGVDMTFREPLGVVGLIVPWNFPLDDRLLEGRAGARRRQRVVLKPAELTPLSAVELERIALEAGLPEGVLNVVAGPGSVCGARLVEHPDVAKIAFTGSTEVGRGIAAGAAATIKRVTLELGGKSANVVFADADLEAAAAAAPDGGLRQRRPGLLRPLADPGRALGARRLPRGAGAGGRGHPGRRPARRGDPDGPADLGRPAPRRSPPTSPTTRRWRSAAARPRAPATGSRRPSSPRSRTPTARRARRSSARSSA